VIRSIVLLSLLAVSGCQGLDKDPENGGLTYDLPVKWRPLEKIRERGNILNTVIQSDTAITTVGTSAYVKDLTKWLDKHPPNSLMFNAIMRHEQEHAKRQLDYGLYTWIAKYSYDRNFALEEELIGWYYQVTTLSNMGQQINVDAVAAILAGYRNLTGKLITFEEAQNWVRDVLAGHWIPAG